MINSLTKLKSTESNYKQIIDESNNFIAKFRRTMLKKCRRLRDLEFPRCDQIHSSINQFVVYEMSAEMNNKYDLGNFARLLESFTPQQEMKTLDQYLYGVIQEKSTNEPDEADAGSGRSLNNIRGTKTDNPYKLSCESDYSSDETHEPQE